ncbi:MAG: peptide-N-glycosidase F-related protein [bacterium]|nr:peptide-N-glycosidase F-related protein [bacterium]
MLICFCQTWSAVDWDGEIRVAIFDRGQIRYQPDSVGQFDTESLKAKENGRAIEQEVSLPVLAEPFRITAHLIMEPIPKDELSVHDKWDRAGSLYLVQPGEPNLELVKFVTAYGGRTEHRVDISHLAPLLSGKRTVGAFIDTWVSPAWKVSCELTYTPVEEPSVAPVWVMPVFNEPAFDAQTYGETGEELELSIPNGADRVMLYYLVSGHCTDGRGADEFESKDNVLSVDSSVVYRFRPWRDDCRKFREINPYTRRWSDGNWSSDYDRSGWCPGDMVEPLELDLTDHLNSGDHRLGIVIEDIRPRDEEEHYGYWRVSAYLVGFRKNSAGQGEN